MLGDNVRNLREKMGYSQNKFAKICELPRTTLQRIEAKGNPCYEQLCKICRGLGLKPNDVIPEEDYK